MARYRAARFPTHPPTHTNTHTHTHTHTPHTIPQPGGLGRDRPSWILRPVWVVIGSGVGRRISPVNSGGARARFPPAPGVGAASFGRPAQGQATWVSMGRAREADAARQAGHFAEVHHRPCAMAVPCPSGFACGRCGTPGRFFPSLPSAHLRPICQPTLERPRVGRGTSDAMQIDEEGAERGEVAARGSLGLRGCGTLAARRAAIGAAGPMARVQRRRNLTDERWLDGWHADGAIDARDGRGVGR